MALPHLWNDALWWHGLPKPVALCGRLSPQPLGLGWQGDFVLEGRRHLLYGAALPTFLRAKAKVCVEEDEGTKQGLGLERETSLSTRKMFLLNSHGVC